MPNRSTVRRHFGFALVLTFCMLPLQSATLERLSLDSMIAKSTAIVRGKVSSSSAAFRGPVIYTHYIIQVAETLKGTAGGAIDLAVPGGSARNVHQTFPGAPQLAPGNEFVFFLWTGPSGLTQIIGLTQGLFAVTAPAGATPMVRRDSSRELMLDPGTGNPVKDETLTMSLTDLRARVTGTLTRSAAQ